MPQTFRRPPHASFGLIVLTFVLASVGAHTAAAQSIQGTATFRERIALPPDAVFEATLEDASRADAPERVVARARRAPAPNPPITFVLTYEASRIRPNRTYVVRATIRAGDRLMFTTSDVYRVLTRGTTDTVSLMLRSAGAVAPQSPGGAAGAVAPLQKTDWKAIELGGVAIPNPPAGREATLRLDEGRVAGSDGCNRVSGTYMLSGDSITFGRFAVTQMACPGSGDVERRFHEALGATRRWRITGNRLELSDGMGKVVAKFDARTPPPATQADDGLGGTSWQLAKRPALHEPSREGGSLMADGGVYEPIASRNRL